MQLHSRHGVQAGLHQRLLGVHIAAKQLLHHTLQLLLHLLLALLRGRHRKGPRCRAPRRGRLRLRRGS